MISSDERQSRRLQMSVAQRVTRPSARLRAERGAAFLKRLGSTQSVQGGREKLRRLLYMPAVAAIRCNPDLARKYTALRAAGKPPKVAITAVMRKLVVLANILVQQDRLWTPRPEPTT